MKTASILVTGASGFVGRSLCAELFRQGHAVRVAVRSENVHVDSFERAIVGSVDDGVDWSSALDGMDVVVHLAARVHVMHETVSDPLLVFRATNVEGTLNLAKQAAAAGVRRFIFISSTGVNGAQTTLPFTELDSPNPHNAYTLSKWEAEQGLQEISKETGLEIVIIRPPLVYGAHAPGNFASLIRAVQRGIPLPLGAIHNKRSFVYVGNLVSLILRCIDQPAAANQVFLVSDGCDLSTTELLRGCAKALGVKSRLLPVPQKLIEAGSALIGKRDVAQRLCGNLQVDITKARTLLGWTPPISVTDGLKATALGPAKNE